MLKTKNLNIFNNLSPLKNRTRSNLHNGSCLSDKIESIFPPLTTTVNVNFISTKSWRPNPKKNYKPMLCTDVDEDLKSTHIFVNQWLFHHHGHQDFVLILFLGVCFSKKRNSTSILILPQQSPSSLGKLLLKLSTKICILPMKLMQHGQCSALNLALILGIPKLFVAANQHAVLTKQKSWRSISSSWK